MRIELPEHAERRRRWSSDDKARIVEASFETGVSVCSVVRQYGIAKGLLFTWQRQAREGRLGGDTQGPDLVPVTNAPEPSLPVPVAQSDDPRAPAPPRRPRRKSGVIEIDLGGARRLTVDRNAEALRLVLDALEGR